ncbi:MAG: TIGR00366 family protein [Planctomycetota bacterium]
MNKPSRFPHPLVLIFGMVVFAQILTYVLPKGEFATEPLASSGQAYAEPDGKAPLRERLATARKERGLSPAQLAALFVVSDSTVGEWEAGPLTEGEAWRPGTHIEAHVGRLLERWVDTGQAPDGAEIAEWKTAVAGRKRVVPGTYARSDSPGLPWHASLTSIAKGFGEAQDIIFFVFIVGGVIAIVRATGAIDALIGAAIRLFAGVPVLLVAGMTLLFAIGSSTIGMAEEYMPFIPILVTLSLALKMDAVVAMGIVYIGAGVGYGCAAVNPFTVTIAQEIAGVERQSGWEFRVLFMLVAAAIGVAYIMRYAHRVQRDPERSLVAHIDYSQGYEMPENVTLTPARVGVLVAFAAAIVVFVWGAKTQDWYFTELMALFLGLGILSAVLGRISPNAAAVRFCEGAAEMTTTALLIGVARTIEQVLTDGVVIHTIIDGIAQSISGFGPYLASLGMLAVQSITNFFIPSGSGQAYVTMPIMAPLSDLCGVSRQTAVLAYQIGDGFMNMVVPTNALLMGMLALARIPLGRWLKFIVPLMLQLYVLAALALLVASWVWPAQA